jgi:HK97 family phage major capsid protein
MVNYEQMGLNDLRAQHAAEVKSAKAIQATARTAGRELTLEELTAIESHLDICDVLAEHIHYKERRKEPYQPKSRTGGPEARLAAKIGDSNQVPKPRIPWQKTPSANDLFDDRPVNVPAMPKASTWRDKSGQLVAMLPSGESMHDWFYHASGREALNLNNQPFAVGEILKSMTTGDWSGVQFDASLVTGSQTAGGYLLAPEVSSRVIDLARSESVMFRAGAQLVPMSTNELVLAKVASDPSVAWVPEGTAIPESQPAFDRITLRARKLGCIVPITRELAEDAPNAGQQIERLLRESMAAELDRAILLGDGDGEEPIGIFTHGDVQEIGSVGSPTYDDLLDAIQDIEDVNGSPTGYIITPDTKNTLSKLKEATTDGYLRAPQEVAELQRLVTTRLANTQALLGDFEQVIVGVRLDGMRVEVTTTGGDAFSEHKVLVKATWRGDVQFMHANHIVKLTGIS